MEILCFVASCVVRFVLDHDSLLAGYATHRERAAAEPPRDAQLFLARAFNRGTAATTTTTGGVGATSFALCLLTNMDRGG
jgi:hypothetical protein